MDSGVVDRISLLVDGSLDTELARNQKILKGMDTYGTEKIR